MGESCIERMERIDAKTKIANFIVKEKQPYEFKVKYAELRVREFVDECNRRGLNYHVSIGGLDSITLFCFLKSLGIDAPGISVSHLEDVSIQRVHRELGIEKLKPSVRYVDENGVEHRWSNAKELDNKKYVVDCLLETNREGMKVMFGNQLDSIDSTMRNVYKSGYYHTAYEIQKGVGVGWDFSALDDKQISKVINKPWAVDGKNFSERIWGNAKTGSYTQEFDERYRSIAEEIETLKKEQADARKKKRLAESYEQRVQDMDAFIKGSTCQIPEFNNDLVRRLISSIKVVSAEKLIIQFQSGIVMEQEIRYD